MKISYKIIFAIFMSLYAFYNTAFAFSDSDFNMVNALESKRDFYQKAVEQPWPVIKPFMILKEGVKSPLIILLKRRLCATGDLLSCNNQEDFFDQTLTQAVQHFQLRHQLNPDGIVGAQTLRELNISPEKRLFQIQLNIERWKIFTQKISSSPYYIWINIPDHMLRLVQNKNIILQSRVIVGKVSRQTPEIDSQIEKIVINPYWYVPPTILQNDIIPKAIKNPAYLNELGIRIIYQGHILNPSKINWQAVKKYRSQYVFRQDPGPQNALGEIKFEFPNHDFIYLHDTPSKDMFNLEKRLLSSGCIRLEQPLNLLQYLMNEDKMLNAQKENIENTLNSLQTRTFKLDKPIPIHITYITAWVDPAGYLYFWKDAYHKDQ